MRFAIITAGVLMLLAGTVIAQEWNIETVVLTGDTDLWNSLVLDSSGYPHISYSEASSEDLMYAHWDGTEWQIETVDSEGNVGITNSLALDSSDNPHISYYDWTNENLKYAFWNGSSWEIETVDSAGDVGGSTSLALDSSDNPHISYCKYYPNNDDLKYAYFSPLGIEDDLVISECLLLGVSPNPSNGTVSIHFGVPEASLVRFSVFDISGRLVSEIKGVEYSQGSHVVQLNELSPGIYFCRMTSGDFSATQRFVVIE